MPMIEKKLRAVIFRRDRIVMHVLENFSAADIYFNATGRARIFAHSTMNDQSRFLSQRFQRFPNFRRDGAFYDHALHHAGTVAQLWKHEFAARTHVVEPAL